MVGSQQPRIKLVPEGEDHPRWKEIVAFVKRLGYELDPWQWMVLRAAMMRDGDQWAAFTVAVCCPRQNGKNSLLEVVELVKTVLLGDKLLIHTAHLADTAKEGFRRIDDLLDSNGWLDDQVKHVWRANGMETIEFTGGRRIRFRTRTRGGGRGYAGCSTAIFDEAMFLPEVAMGSILPVISASPDPQIWYTGSAVDQEFMEDGVVFARARERALRGDSDRLAYFEWSLEAASPEEVGEDVSADPASWAKTNPALGRRIKPEYLKVEREELDPRTFAVERLGVGDWPDPRHQTLIDMEKWRRLSDGSSEIAGTVALAFDVPPDRSSASICAAGFRRDGHFHLEVVDRRRGTSWVAARLSELCAGHDVSGLACDSAGPAGSLVHEVEEQSGREVLQVSARDLADACGFFFDAVENETLRHLGTPELMASLRGAVKRPLGDAWAWSRKNSAVDICPLVAATLALWSASTIRKQEVFALAW